MEDLTEQGCYWSRYGHDVHFGTEKQCPSCVDLPECPKCGVKGHTMKINGPGLGDQKWMRCNKCDYSVGNHATFEEAMRSFYENQI